MSDDLDEILDSIFHGCAWAAYVDQIREEQRWPPDMESTRQRANRYYEEELARKNQSRQSALAVPSISIRGPSSEACVEPQPTPP